MTEQEPIPAVGPAAGSLEPRPDPAGLVLAVLGHWELDAAQTLEAAVAGVTPDTLALAPRGSTIRLDLSRLAALDTVGALVLDRLRQRLNAEDYQVAVVGPTTAHAALLEVVWRGAAEAGQGPMARHHQPLADLVASIGRQWLELIHGALEMIAFFGLICVRMARVVADPRRIRVRALVYHIEHVGLHALPILGLLLFLIGVVLAYQGAGQLRKVGGEIYVVNLLGLSILREIGPLVTAIIVAGRSGSAFTAQLGTMKVNQEIDAMRTLGLDPVELLVIPRMLALVLVLPLLTFYACMVALAGGALMSYLVLDITAAQFITQMRAGLLDVYDVICGELKTPVFAAVIALVGCHEGMQVSGSAESVGLRTTRAVVESIFLVIVINALFSILFSFLHL